MGIRFLKLNKNSRGQTALEYALVLIVLILPLAAAVRGILGSDEEDARGAFSKRKQPENGMQKLVTDAYGDESRLGIIGRPYP